jgi:hypothetical protein
MPTMQLSINVITTEVDLSSHVNNLLEALDLIK